MTRCGPGFLLILFSIRTYSPGFRHCLPEADAASLMSDFGRFMSHAYRPDDACRVTLSTILKSGFVLSRENSRSRDAGIVLNGVPRFAVIEFFSKPGPVAANDFDKIPTNFSAPIEIQDAVDNVKGVCSSNRRSGGPVI